MKLLGMDQIDSKFSKCRNGLFVAVAAVGLISACAPEAACVMIDDPMIVQKLNEAVRKWLAIWAMLDNYTHTFEQELSETAVVYSDCGSHYTVTFTPISNDPELVAIGNTTTYAVSKRGLKVTLIIED